MTTTATHVFVTAIAAGTAPVPFDFQAASEEEVAVSLDGVWLTYIADFTVTLNGDGTGIVTPVADWGTGEVLILSDPSYQQTANFTRYGAFYPDQFNPPLDRLNRYILRLAEDMRRSLKGPFGAEGLEYDNTPNMVFGTDDTGNPVQLTYLPGGVDGVRASELSATGGGTLVGVNDNAGGTLFTTLAGFVTKLLSSTGAAIVGFIQSGTGAIFRTLQSKARDVIHAKDFGVVADGTTNDTAAMQVAIDAAGAASAELRLPRGSILINATLNLNVQSVTIRGEGPFATRIECTTLNTKIFNVTATQCRIIGLSTHYSGGTPAAGAQAIVVNSTHFTGRDILIRNAYDGVVTFGSSNVRFRGLTVLDFESTAFWAYDTALDVFCSQFYFNCGNATRGALGAIRLQNQVEAANFTDGEILQGVYSLATAAVTNGPGTRPAYAKFTNIYFDSSAQGVLIDKVAEIEFHNCWFSNRPNNGVVLNNCDGVRFIGGGALNCGQRGVLVNNTAVRTIFKGFTARGNSQATANTYDGITIAAGTTDFIIQGCTLGGSLGFGSQRWGALINTGASDRYIVADNLVTGNTTGGVSDNGTGVNKRVANNY